MPTGNATQPSLTFSTDPDTGMYRPAEDQIALSTGGADRVIVHDLGANVTGNVTAAGFAGNGHQISHIQVANVDGLSTALDVIDNSSVTTNALTVNGNITTTGNVLAGGDIVAFSSDERLKTQVEPITGALGTLDSLNGYRFTWRDDIPGLPMRGRDMGLLAQDLVRAGATECVTFAPFDRDPQTNESKSGHHYLTISYNKVHAISIAAIKELVEQVDALQARVDALEKARKPGGDL